MLKRSEWADFGLCRFSDCRTVPLAPRDLPCCTDHHSLFRPLMIDDLTYPARQRALPDACGACRVIAVMGFLKAHWHRPRTSPNQRCRTSCDLSRSTAILHCG